MSLTTERKLPIILFFVFLILTAIGFLFYQSTASLQEAIGWGKKTNEFVSLADSLFILSVDVENGARDFVLTGNDTYLVPFNRAKPRIVQNIARLRVLSADEPGRLEEIGRLETSLNEAIAEATRKIDLRKSKGFEDSVYEATSPRDRPRTEAIRASVDRLKALEVGQLQTREQSVDRDLTSTIWILIVSSIAGIVSLALANFIVYREMKKRQSAEVALIDANRGLEERIEKRTAELQVVNDRLLDIGSERELLLVNEKRARQEAEIANRLRDEFMATVSHELRTPLNSILGWARLMKDGTLNDNQSERAVATIIKNSETQNRLIEDLLDVARVISGKLELKHEKLEVVDVLNHAIESARPVADAKNIAIRLHADQSAAHAMIEADDDRMRQVFSNLLTNAIKFSLEGDKIEVYAKAKDGEAVIDVIDEGIGINAEFLPLVFERFRQDAAGERKNGGLGLGLAIVRNLVEMHGGSVSVESQGENKGAKFTVLLPLAEN